MSRDQHSYAEWREHWPKVVVRCQTDEAVDALETYYQLDDSGKPSHTGARFEAIAALNDDPNTLAPADFVAVSMLSVNVPPKAAVRLLGHDLASISSLLKQIPPNRDIVDVDAEVLAPNSAADKLWRVLRHGKDGLGPTRTSKLIAAKRPRLIPIWDSHVKQATGLDTRDYWRRFQNVLGADDSRIWKWLGQLRSHPSNLPPAVRELRILDVLLWMSVEGH